MNVPTHDDFLRLFGDPVWLAIGAEICRRHGIPHTLITRAEHGESVVLYVEDRFVLKIYRPWKTGFGREKLALENVVRRLELEVPEIAAEGNVEGYDYLITTRIPGRLMTRAEWLSVDRDAQIGLLHQLADGLQVLHSVDSGRIDFDWAEFVRKQAAGAVERQRSEGGNPEWLERLPSYIDENLRLIPLDGPHVFLHGDVHFGNIRIVEHHGRLKIAGLFDFADSLRGFHAYDFIAVGVLMIQGQGDLQREFFRRYGYADAAINEELRRTMMLLTIFYEWSSLRRYAERLGVDPMQYSLDELERAIWNFA
jgi:hygromycin-B 7''-O-kinase